MPVVKLKGNVDANRRVVDKRYQIDKTKWTSVPQKVGERLAREEPDVYEVEFEEGAPADLVKQNQEVNNEVVLPTTE